MANIFDTLHPKTSPSDNLYPNIKSNNIPSGAVSLVKLGSDVKAILNTINSLRPAGVDTSANILAFASDDGVWVGSDTGHWYYWDGAQYVDSGLDFVSTTNDELSSQVTELNSIVNELSDYLEENPNNLFNKYNYLKEENMYVNASSTVTSFSGCLIITLEINGVAGEEYRSNMFNQDILDYNLVAYVPFTSNDIPYVGLVALEDFRSTSNNSLKRFSAALTTNAKYLNIMFRFSSESDMNDNLQNVLDGLAIKKTTEWIDSYQNHYLTVKESVNMSTWHDKIAWWCGTSIPEGVNPNTSSEYYGESYPQIVGDILNVKTMTNTSLGSSMCRANVRTGDYVNAVSYNLIYALTQTTEEKQDLISNWGTIKDVLYDPNTFADLSNVSTYVLNSTFEKKLIPYLDGTYDMPDLFVIDHGHNDYKPYYSLSNGNPDIELEPTVANIESGELAEDTYMTANNYYNLKRFIGDLSHIPSNQFDSFVASLNRNCYKGAVNFLITVILYHNPRARIVFIGNLDNWIKPELTTAQESIANSWLFPLIEVWKYLGLSSHIVPNSYNYWGTSNPTDFTVKQIYCKDNVHPHTDTTGVTIEKYANIIANKLKQYV